MLAEARNLWGTFEDLQHLWPRAKLRPWYPPVALLAALCMGLESYLDFLEDRAPKHCHAAKPHPWQAQAGFRHHNHGQWELTLMDMGDLTEQPMDWVRYVVGPMVAKGVANILVFGHWKLSSAGIFSGICGTGQS